MLHMFVLCVWSSGCKHGESLFYLLRIDMRICVNNTCHYVYIYKYKDR